ncbi:class B sortase [Lachnospiraceae bacterium C1.1]|nr:class B sortase [Lachnospiraceae bacterium C1.1]
MGNSKASKIVLLLDSIVTTIISLFFLAVIACGIYCIWDSNQVYMDADASNYTAYKPSDDSLLSFEELRKINPDVFGWIEIYGTEIDYPLLQGKDNLEYVNTDVLKNYSLSGAVFLDSAKPKDFSDFKSVIYGHHMEQHKMFGDIDLFAAESFFDEHKYGNIYYDEKEHGLEIFSYIECDAYDSMVYGEYEDGNEQEFIGQIKSRSKYYRDIDLTKDDHIVVLSTCDYSYTDGRMVLLARISDTKYNNRYEN